MGLIITIAIITAIIIAVIKNNADKASKLQALKQGYNKALKGTNKKAALDAGRAYYSALRENKTLTIYDEQAITNDLSTMVDQSEVIRHSSSSQL